jgi:serine/threonine protein kinase
MGVRTDRKLAAGSRFGSYTVLEYLGRGATATVYECRHDKLGRRFAVKLLHSHLANDPVVRARLFREGRALSRLRHPNIVDVCDVGEIDGVPYLVMSAIEGRDLSDHLRVSGSMTIADTVDCILPIVDALSFAHRAGIVHRDLKPSNIRLTRDHLGNLVPKVLDFGVSKVVSEAMEPDLTESHGPLGTASYMAPEQIQSARTVDSRADVYAVGVILYEALTGERPFRGLNGYEIMHAVLTAPVVAPGLSRPDVPFALDQVVMRAMQRDPARRFPSAQDLGLALAPFASNPQTWLDRFRGPSALPSSPSIAPIAASEASFTMISGTSTARTRARGLTIGVGIAAVGAVLAGLNVRAMPPRQRSATSVQSSGAAVVVPPPATSAGGAASPPLRLTSSSTSGAPAGPDDRGPAAELRPIPSRRLERPSGSARTQGEASALPAPASPLTKEFGANGSPILE